MGRLRSLSGANCGSQHARTTATDRRTVRSRRHGNLQPEVAAVENGAVTALAAGQATIQASYQSRTASLQVTVEAAFAFDPPPPATIIAGGYGHFRVNITEDGSPQRLTDGVTSSAQTVVQLRLEGDRWRYTGVGAGSAEIRVEHDGRRRLTHAITVQPPSVCQVNQELGPGESCQIPPSYTFEVNRQGHGCISGSNIGGRPICQNESWDIRGFRASRIGGTSRWRIEAMPGAPD